MGLIHVIILLQFFNIWKFVRRMSCHKKTNLDSILHWKCCKSLELPSTTHVQYSDRWQCSSANGHYIASQYSAMAWHHIGPPCIRTNQKFRHKFSVFECMKIAQNYAQVSLPLSHIIQYSKRFFWFCFCFFFLLEGTFSLEKWKSKWPTVRNMCFQKLWKILFFITKHYW